MAATPRLQTLSAEDLDGLIAELKQQGSTELILVGPAVRLATNLKHWPDDLRQASVVYQLKEVVPGLAQRLAALTQLTSLNLYGNEIGAAGAASLAALTQLTSLNLWGNHIGAAGAASLAALTQLTSLDLESNGIEVVRLFWTAPIVNL
jgi:Leucine-rich repeat (LRR) protein